LHKILPTLLILIGLNFSPIFAQDRPSISGKITETGSGQAIIGANIQCHSLDNPTKKIGLITAADGSYVLGLNFGEYSLKISAIGYETLNSSFVFNEKNKLFNFSLKPSTTALQEVEVQTQRNIMTLEADKRIFNLSADLTNRGANASEVLANIPSVQVDPDGAIKLRGSESVRILIDGKPSGLASLKGGGGLQNLPANLIDRVEIITNPSARYEAEGQGGIINIILKKDQRKGFNGFLESIAGLPTNLGYGMGLNYRVQKLNFFINYGLSYRNAPNIGSVNQQLLGDNPLQTTIERVGSLQGLNNNIRGGIDYFFSETSMLTASYLFKRSDAKRITDLQYWDYLQANLTAYTQRNQTEVEDEPNSEYSLNFKKDFKTKGHAFTADFKYIDNWERSNQTFTQKAFFGLNKVNQNESYVQKSLNDEFERNWIGQLDYQKPITAQGKVELGLRSSIRDMVNDFFVRQLNPNGSLSDVPGLVNYFVYDENITAAYALMAHKNKKWNYQVGLRAENSYIKTELKNTNQTNLRNYTNLFPSMSIGYNFHTESQLQFSYSRRIKRPLYNDLSPFMTFADNRNFFSGNPNLNPEFTHALEVIYLKNYNKGSFSSTLFSRNTTNKIQSLRNIDSNGNSTTLPVNLNQENSQGLEIISTFQPNKHWKADANLTYFWAQVNGKNINPGYVRDLSSWVTRANTKYTFTNKLEVQLRANYEARQKTIQGYRLPIAYADLALSKDILKNKGALTFTITDLFNSRIQRFQFESENFTTKSVSQYRRRQFNLSLLYKINPQKSTKKAKSLLEE
jgi:ferric enterobactin receptor